MDLKLEIIILPVADVDRAKDFYEGIGFRLDADLSTDRGLRVIQLTPPGSHASIMVGDNLTSAAAGSLRGLHLITGDLEQARSELLRVGVDVSPIWHDQDGVFHWAGDANRIHGPNTEHDSYSSYASFDDPDGNEWIIQQVVNRLPGR